MHPTIYVLATCFFLSTYVSSQYTRGYRMYRQESYMVPKPPQPYEFGARLESGFVPITGSYDLNFPDIGPSLHNSIEKPVEEPQEYIPPQSVGTANIPLLPPPAVPVNAAAANVPTATGAVFLGSGSIGVVALSNGAYALGSGALGYSDMRGQPRPSANVPVFPRLPATPDLIPAAVPSNPPPPPPRQAFQEFVYHPTLGFTSHPADPNAYENLRSAGFGDPVLRPPRPPRQHYATPTVQVLQAHNQYVPALSPQIGANVPRTTYSYSI